MDHLSPYSKTYSKTYNEEFRKTYQKTLTALRNKKQTRFRRKSLIKAKYGSKSRSNLALFWRNIVYDVDITANIAIFT